MNEVSAIEVSLLYAVRLKWTVWWHDWKSIRSGGGWGSKDSLCDQQKVVTSMKKSNGNLLWWHHQEILWWRGGRQGVCC